MPGKCGCKWPLYNLEVLGEPCFEKRGMGRVGFGRLGLNHLRLTITFIDFGVWVLDIGVYFTWFARALPWYPGLRILNYLTEV